MPTKLHHCMYAADANAYVQGPCTEELVFRSCMLTSIQHLNPHVSKATLMLTPPLYLGIAHIHLAWESLKQGGFTKRAGRLAFQSSGMYNTGHDLMTQPRSLAVHLHIRVWMVCGLFIHAHWHGMGTANRTHPL